MHLCGLYNSWNNSEAGGRGDAILTALPKENNNSIFFIFKTVTQK